MQCVLEQMGIASIKKFKHGLIYSATLGVRSRLEDQHDLVYFDVAEFLDVRYSTNILFTVYEHNVQKGAEIVEYQRSTTCPFPRANIQIIRRPRQTVWLETGLTLWETESQVALENAHHIESWSSGVFQNSIRRRRKWKLSSHLHE